MSQQPWACGPSEILQHGLSLLNKDSDSNRRLAMLSIDNAVELTIKTFLSLPKRITGINLSRKEFQEISESFPQLLDALEKHATDKLAGIDLREIEWFHRLRNQLYHQGNGLTVDKEKVEIYAQLGRILFRNLFGFDVAVKKNEGFDLLGTFLAKWVQIERSLTEIALNNPDQISTKSKDLLSLKGISASISSELARAKIISQGTSSSIDELRLIRNKTIHGQDDYRESITKEILVKADLIIQDLSKALA